jgi:hypothetical protein
MEWLRRPVIAGLLLLVMYCGLSLALNDARGTLGTDTGGKLATLHMMELHGGLDPSVGYWAAHDDPTGVLHPLYYTYRVGDDWVNVTTLPMLYAAYPLYRIGGDRAVLLLPMLGAVVAAFAARALARRLGGGSAWTAFWVIGLASPVAIYALDFWEHSVGLALMLWGVVLVLDVVQRRAGWRGALGAGALFGAAATMRQEALVYFVVAGAVMAIAIVARERAFVRAFVRGAAMLVGAAAVLLANDTLERASLGSSLRTSRATGTAVAAGASLGTRVREAFTTTIGLNRFEPDLDFLLGGLIVALVAYGAWRLSRDDRDSRVFGGAALIAAACCYLVRFGGGLGFVPGVISAAPFAAVGLCLGWRRTLRFPTFIACAALPIVWIFQYSGGAGPQWGGRYELLSGALLVIVGVVALAGRRRALAAVLGLSLLVTAFGVTWLSVRSHGVAAAFETIVARHDQAVISGEAHVLREGGAFYEPGAHWLTATSDAQLRAAVRIVSAAGDREFGYIVTAGRPAPEELGGYVRSGTQRVAFLRSDVALEIVTYRLS